MKLNKKCLQNETTKNGSQTNTTALKNLKNQHAM